MSKKSLIAFAAIALVGILVVVVVPAYVRAHRVPSANGCINNLRVINAAKEQWALEHHAQVTNTPSWDDLRQYFSHEKIPICGHGGTYTIGRIDQTPTCSYPGDVLP